MRLNLFLAFLILFSFPSSALDCPEGAYEVNVDLSFSGKKIMFCQKEEDGKLLKHGPEITYDLNGKEISNKYFVDGEISTKPKKVDIKIEGPCNGSQDYIKNLMKKLFALDVDALTMKKEHNVVRGSKGCKGYPRRRLNLFLKSKPFVNQLKFSEQCNFQGDLHFAINKKLKGEFDIQGEPFYDKLIVEYELKKTRKNKVVHLDLDISYAQLTKVGSDNILNFTAVQKLEVNVDELLMSLGARGLVSFPPVIKIKQYNEKVCENN